MIVAATLPLEKPLKCIDHTLSEAGWLNLQQLFLTYCVKVLVQFKQHRCWLSKQMIPYLSVSHTYVPC